MSATTYQALSDKWKAQEKQFEEWRVGLVREAHGLRNDVAAALGAPEKWLSPRTREERRYVEIIDLSTDDKGPASAFSRDAITDDGELVFGISFTFDQALNSYPKSLRHIAMATRYKNGIPEFCFWDTRENRSGTAWQRDKAVVVAEMLANLEKHLSFDPFQGIPGKTGMGFIQE